jgi:DNA-binding transcriptional ArsR family regulator
VVAEHFAISRPAISSHLRVLMECGVVEVTVVGRQRIYSLRTDPLAEVATYLDRLVTPVEPVPLDALATEVARTRRERRTTAGAQTPEKREKETA